VCRYRAVPRPRTHAEVTIPTMGIVMNGARKTAWCVSGAGEEIEPCTYRS
jgi:hypothetical protein